MAKIIDLTEYGAIWNCDGPIYFRTNFRKLLKQCQKEEYSMKTRVQILLVKVSSSGSNTIKENYTVGELFIIWRKCYDLRIFTQIYSEFPEDSTVKLMKIII